MTAEELREKGWTQSHIWWFHEENEAGPFTIAGACDVQRQWDLERFAQCEPASPTILKADDLPIDAEWLASQGWEAGVNIDSERFWWTNMKSVRVAWFEGTSTVTFDCIPTTVKTRGELKTFLAFFGDE